MKWLQVTILSSLGELHDMDDSSIDESINTTSSLFSTAKSDLASEDTTSPYSPFAPPAIRDSHLTLESVEAERNESVSAVSVEDCDEKGKDTEQDCATNTFKDPEESHFDEERENRQSDTLVHGKESAPASAALMKTLVFHPEETTICLTVETILNYSFVVKQSSLQVQTSKGQVEKTFCLLTDSLLVTQPQEDGTQIFETLLEFSRVRVQVRCDDYNNMLQSDDVTTVDERGGRCEESAQDFVELFELIWADGCLEVSTQTKEERDEWMAAILNTIYESVPVEERYIGWKHRLRLGTIHSAVMMHDTLLLERFKEHCEASSSIPSSVLPRLLNIFFSNILRQDVLLY